MDEGSGPHRPLEEVTVSEDVGAVLLSFWKPESLFFSSHLMGRGGDLRDLSMYPTPKPKCEHPGQQEGRTGEQRGGVP